MDWHLIEHGPGGGRTIELLGDCDLFSAPAFWSLVSGVLDAGARDLLLDFHGVSYLDSSGVGTVIRILQKARLKSCTVRFRGISGSPRRVLEMSNILPLLREEEGR